MSCAEKVKAAAAATDEFAPLLEELLALKSQSDDGFEGLVRDLLQHISGRTLRLVKSGPQGGNDVVSDADIARPGIGIEAKRLKPTTDLPLDELKSKLQEALDGSPAIDIWGVAASRELKDPDWSELVKIGSERGVPLLCLDWRSAPGILPPLGALCAAGRQITESRLSAAVIPILERIEQHSGFAATVEIIRRQLTDANVGFDLARDAASHWLDAAVASSANARRYLQSHVDLGSADAHYVSRTAIESALSGWWASGPKRPAVLLGDEGRGKTWVALSWCRQHFSGPSAPMVIAASAKDIRWTDPEEILSGLLHRCMPDVSRAQLAARLKRWLRKKGGVPKILLLLDGLNEAWMTNWSDIVRSFDVEPWKGRVAVLMTSRSAHWREDLINLTGATEEKIFEVPVPSFSDLELIQYLAEHGLTKDQLPDALLELVKIPRFARLAISLRDKLRDSEDMTEARLVLEDWRDRLSHRADLRVDDEGLIEFVADLGKDVLADKDFEISQKEIHGRLSEDSGLDLNHYRPTINEIVEGHWLKPGGRPYVYTVNKHLLPFAIGLDLARAVENLTEEAAIDDIIAKYEEHLRGASVGVAILRAATSVSFMRQKATRAARLALLGAWLRSQNFSQADFDELWSLVSRDAALFLDFAEDYFRENPVGYREGEILPKAIANAAKWPNVIDLLVERLPRWVGAYGTDPISWRHKNIPPNDERKAATSERHAAWNRAQANYPTALAECLRADADDHLTLAAFAIMSFLPRTPFIKALLVTALTQVISGDEANVEHIQWLVRLNPHDHDKLEEKLLAEAAALKNLGSNVASEAANLLLDALATPRAMTARGSRVANDDTKQQALRYWPELGPENVIVWPSLDESTSPLIWAERLTRFSSLPEAGLSAEDMKKLEAAAEGIGADAGVDDFSAMLGRATSAIARWAPTALGQAVRRVYGSLPERPLATAARLGQQLADVSLVLGQGERDHLLKRGFELLGEAPAENAQLKLQRARCCHSMIVAGLVGRTAANQIDTLEKLLPEFQFGEDIAELLTPPTTQDLQRILDLLASETRDTAISGWFGYLNLVQLPLMPSNAAILLSLTKHANEKIRGAATRLITVAQDETLARAFVDSGWNYAEGQDPDEAIYGSYLIARAGTHLAFDEARRRIGYQVLPTLVELRGMRDDELRALFAHTIELMDERVSQRSVRRVSYVYSFKNPKVWRKLVELDDGAIVRKLKEVVLAGRLVGFFDTLPLVELCSAIFELRPEEGAEIWALIKKGHQRHGFNMGDFNNLPFRAPDHEKIIELREALLALAKTDDDLMQIVVPTLLAEREQWLIGFICKAVSAPNAGLVAQGLTLAGMLDQTDAADRLWSDKIERLALDGWLAEVRKTARLKFQRNVLARHWFGQFLATRNPDEAFSSYMLFQDTLDLRYALWLRPTIDTVRDSLPSAWLNHISVTHDTRESGRKKLEDDWKKLLFSTRTVNGISPWL